MGTRNFLIEGVSCTGKTSVCHALRGRGHHAINGDTDLAYQGDPETGEPTDVPSHWHHIWALDRVRELVADDSNPSSFFCGGSRNVLKHEHLCDAVFVLQIDEATLRRRLDERPADEFGARPEERDLVLRLHRTGEGLPTRGIPIDATAPLDDVVEDILRRTLEPDATTHA